ADRAADEFRHFVGEGGADADPRAELLVGCFEASGNVDSVAIGGVIEKPAAAKIADNGRAGMDANARRTECQSLFPAAFAERFGMLVQRQGAGDGARGMVRLLAGSAEQHVERIADDLGHCAIVSKYDV